MCYKIGLFYLLLTFAAYFLDTQDRLSYSTTHKSNVLSKILIGELNIHRGSSMKFLETSLSIGKFKFDQSKNNFPLPLHYSCKTLINFNVQIIQAFSDYPNRKCNNGCTLSCSNCESLIRDIHSCAGVY